MLNGVKIVSFCHFLQGPACDQYLADMGADVIKVEPLQGAYERKWSGADVYVGGISGFYLSANRNKRSVAIDLKHEHGKEVAERLIASADVVVENFRPGVFAKLGFDQQKLNQLNPKLIFASASGYGSSGPLVEKPGQDLLAQARFGLMSATGGQGIGPVPIGSTIVDQHGGALLALGIVGALVRLAREDKGTRVEGSLLNSAIDLQSEPLVNWFAGGITRDRLNRESNLATWFHAAPYGVYPARDGHIVISLCQLMDLATALESEELVLLAGEDRYEKRDEIARSVRSGTARFSIKQLESRLDRHNVWWAPVQHYDQLLADPQLNHMQVFRRINVRGRAMYLVNHPNRYDGNVPDLTILALEIGEHTREVLRELSYTSVEIDGLIACSAVVASEGSEQAWSVND
ncbi:MAG: CoA transferase [Hyphomicrobiales bacterium]|nr:MAG: CoA transferase [Hyphomicrobiales bacterium]